MTRSLCLLVLIVCTAACVHRTENTDVRDVQIVPGVTTKEELIRALGAPTGSRLQGSDTVFVFGSGEVNGTGYGIGSAVVGFLAESTHGALDSLEVVVGPDRKVRSYRMAEVPHEHPVWPAGD